MAVGWKRKDELSSAGVHDTKLNGWSSLLDMKEKRTGCCVSDY